MNALHSIAHFLLSPFQLVLEYGSEAIELQQRRQEINQIVQGTVIPIDTCDLPPKVKKTVSRFIETECHVATDSIRLLENLSENCTSDAVEEGSESGEAYIALSSAMVSEMQKSFSGKHKFILAHEIGHLVNEDTLEKRLRQAYILKWVKFASYALTILTLGALSYRFIRPSKTTLIGALLGSHTIACLLSDKVASFISKKINHIKELKADKFAASLSREMALTGIKSLQEDQVERREHLEDLVNGLGAHRKNRVHLTPQEIQRHQEFINRTTPEGDTLLTSHPTASERIARLQDVLRQVPSRPRIIQAPQPGT